MRLLQRTRAQVFLYPREPLAGELCFAEAFSKTGVPAFASISYVANALNGNFNALFSAPFGVRAAQTVRLRFQGRAALKAGDGVSLPGEDAPCWRCVEVNVYPQTTVARLERIAE